MKRFSEIEDTLQVESIKKFKEIVGHEIVVLKTKDIEHKMFGEAVVFFFSFVEDKEKLVHVSITSHTVVSKKLRNASIKNELPLLGKISEIKGKNRNYYDIQ